MRFALLAVVLQSCVPDTMSMFCEIVSSTLTFHGRDIDLTCEDDVKFSLKMTDKDGFSTLEVSGSKIEEEFRFLKVEHDGASNEMFLTLDGKRFDVKDDNTADESAALEDLLTNPNFSSFPAAVQLIHDELKLPGWKSPSIMFLYRIGMSLDDHHTSRQRRAKTVDEDILDYHGWFPAKSCQQNGSKYNDVDDLIAKNCPGTCGPKCMMCWQWVCGDCCIHTGCTRHDQFCRGKSIKDCATFRGVLWDTITDTPYDC